MSQKRCGTCTYLGDKGLLAFDPESQELRETEHRQCLRIIHANSHKRPYEVIRREHAVATDGDGYRASLYVLPSFYCCLYVSRVRA